MRRKRPWLYRGLVTLALIFSGAGCAQTQTLLQEDSANYKRHEQLIMVPQSSGQDTNQELWMDMEGGGSAVLINLTITLDAVSPAQAEVRLGQPGRRRQDTKGG